MTIERKGELLMTARKKLLELENVYDQKGSSELFMEAMRDCVAHHMAGNEFFKRWQL